MTKYIGFFLFTVLFAGCSVTKSSETCIYNNREINCADRPGRNEKPVDENSRYQFKCNNETCDSRTQYCLRLDDFTGRTQTMGCRSKGNPNNPNNTCNSCSCLKRLAQTTYPATCASEPTCEDFGSSIVGVICRAQ
jgi:hypothetical protein